MGLEKNPTAIESETRARNIVRGVGSLSIQSVANAVLGFVLLASLVRFLSLSDYGTYSSVQVSIGLTSTVSAFGLSSAVVFYLASESNSKAGWGAAKASLYLSIAFSAAASLFMFATAPFFSSYFGKSASLTWVFYLGALWLFGTGVAASLQSMLQGMRKYSTLARVLLVSRLLAVIFAVTGLVLYHSLALAVAANIVFPFLTIAIALPIVWDSLHGADPKPHYSLILRYAYLLGLASIVGAVASNADLVVVGGYLNLGSLGIYNAAIQISSVLTAFFVAPLTTALFAETSLSSESEDELKAGTFLALRFAMVTLLPASFLATAMAPQLVSLFSGGSGRYALGVPYLELITLFYIFTAIQSMAGTVLLGIGRTRQVLYVGVVTAVAEIALSTSLVPWLGLAGAAYSRVVVFVMGCALSLYLIREYLPRFERRFYVKSLLASAIPAGVVYTASGVISNTVITVVPYTVLGVALFVVCVRLLKLLSLEDKSYLKHLLPHQLHWIFRLL